MTTENPRNEIRNSLCDVAFKPRHYRIIAEGVAYALGRIKYPTEAILGTPADLAMVEGIVREEAEAELKKMAKTRTILEDMREALPTDRDTRADLLAVAQQIGRAVYPFCYEAGEAKAAVDAMAHYQEEDLYEHRLKMSEAPSVVLDGDVLLASNRAQSALRHLLRYLEGGEVWHLPKAWLSARQTLEAAHDGEALRARMRALDLAVIGVLPEWLRHDMGMDTPPVVNVVQADAAPKRGLGLNWARIPAQEEPTIAKWQAELNALHEVRLGEHNALKGIAGFVGVDCMAPGFALMTAREAIRLIQDGRKRVGELEKELARLRDLLARLTPPGDVYLDLPPPSEWPQPRTGTAALDPAQQRAYDALQKVTRERATEIAATLADVAKAKVAAEDERDAARRKVDDLRDALETAEELAEHRRSEALDAEELEREAQDALDRARGWAALWHERARHYRRLNQEGSEAADRTVRIQIAATNEEARRRQRAEAEVARLRPHYDAIMVLAGACDGDPNDPASVATTFLDIGKAMLQARRERDSIREDLDAARAEAKAGMDAYLVERRKRGEAEAELARLRERPSPDMVEEIIHGAKMDQLRRRIGDLAAALGTKPEGKPDDWHRLIGKVCDLREQTTPRRLSAPLVVKQPVLAWQRDAWFPAFHPVGLAPGNWILPQPPPPPDEPRQKATNPEEQESEGVTRA